MYSRMSGCIHCPGGRACSRRVPGLRKAQCHGVSCRNGRPTFLSFLRDKGEMAEHTEGMSSLDLTSYSLKKQPKLVNMGVVGQ